MPDFAPAFSGGLVAVPRYVAWGCTHTRGWTVVGVGSSVTQARLMARQSPTTALPFWGVRIMAYGEGPPAEPPPDRNGQRRDNDPPPRGYIGQRQDDGPHERRGPHDRRTDDTRGG
jgi:hypothetical protein